MLLAQSLGLEHMGLGESHAGAYPPKTFTDPDTCIRNGGNLPDQRRLASLFARSAANSVPAFHTGHSRELARRLPTR